MKALLAPLAASVLALAASAGEVKDDSSWTDGSSTVTVDITQNSSANDATVKFTDSAGTSPGATGTLGPSSTEAKPTATESDGASTPQPGGSTYRLKDGKVQKRNAQGQWVTWREVKKKKASGMPLYEQLQAGDPAPSDGTLRSFLRGSIPLLQGELAPWPGVFHPEETVVSLPL